MPESPRVDIRFYNSAGTQRRLQSKDTSIVSARWKSSRYGGYKEGDFTLSGSLLELTESDSAGGRQPVRENDRCRVVAVLPDLTEQLRWSGIVRSVRRILGQPNTVQIQCTGKFADVSEVPVNGRFISPVPVDVTQAFASFAYVEAQAAFPDLSIDVGSADVGVDTQAEDAFNKSLGAALTGLSERFAGLVVYGCDELNGGSINLPLVDRLFLRNIGSLTSPDYTFDVPGGFNGAWFDLAEGGKDVTRLANTLTITGTTALYPNYLGDACKGNVGFERPIFTDFSSNPLLLNFSFEFAGLPSWSLTGGASQKIASIEGIPARSGERYLELDAVGEKASQTITTSLTTGQTVLVGVNARRENAGFGASYKIGIQFKNGGADVGALQQSDAISPADAYYRESSFQAAVPGGTVTGFVVSYEMTAGGGDGQGLCLDDGFAYIAALKQEGWSLVDVGGSGTINSVDYAHSADKTQGRYSLKLDVSSSDSDGNDVYLETTGRFPVNAGAILEFGGDFRTWDATTNGKFRLDLRFFDSDGAETGSAELTVITAGTVGGTWVQKRSNAKTVPNGAVTCLARITFRGNNKLLIDRLYVRDTAAPIVDAVDGEREWIDSGPYRTTIDTSDTIFASKSYSNSISRYGRRYEQIQSDAVVDLATARAVAMGFFDVYALPLARPILRIQGSPIAFRCGETVRIAGEAGQWLGNTPTGGAESLGYAIAEIEETADATGKISTTLALEIEQPSLEATIARIFDKKRRATTGGGVASLAGSPVGGSGGASQSLSLPVSIANGGTAATTASDARTSLGLGGGESDTIALAKLTPAGADGSLTFTNGILTSHVDPT